MKRLAINANGNAITSFARELNPTGVWKYIYIYTHLLYIYIYIYIADVFFGSRFFVGVFY